MHDLQVNGLSVGEGGMNAPMAAWYGVPVVLVTGDDVAVEEVKAIGAERATVAVKRAINMRAVELLPLAEARRADRGRAPREAVAGREEAGARCASGPYKVHDALPQLHHSGSGHRVPRDRRPAPDTVEFARDAMPEAYRLIRVLYRFINPD